MGWDSSNARCLQLGIDPNVFFPERDHLGQIAYAKSICLKCDIRQECLDYAMKTRQEHGIWGGCTESERRTIRVRAAVQDYSSRHNKPHEQEHHKRAYSSSPSHTSDEYSRNQQASLKDFALRLASRVSGIEVSKLQSLEESPLDRNRKLQFVRALAELEKIRRQPNQNFVSVLEAQEAANLSSSQNPSVRLVVPPLKLKPNQLSDQDQSLTPA